MSRLKVSDAGLIPEDWSVSTVGSEFEIRLGKMLDSEKNKGLPKPYVGNRAVQWNTIDIDDLPLVPLSTSDLNRFRLRRGDLLVCEGGEVGRAAIWEDPLDECYYQKALHRLRPLRGFDSRLMLAFLHLWSASGKLQNHVTQTSIAHLTREKLALVPLPVPSREEQRAIAELLEDVNGLLSSMAHLAAKKRDLKQAVMQQLLSRQARLPGFTDEWTEKPLGTQLLGRPDYGINAPAVGFSDRLPTYLRITDITDDGRLSTDPRVSVAKTATDRYYLREGELVFARTGASVGKSYLYDPRDGPLVFAGFLIRIRPDASRLVPRFLAAYVKTYSYWNWVRLMSMRSGQPGINGNEFTQLPVVVPSVGEQTAIAEFLSDMDDEIEALERRLDKTRALKQGMMQALLIGRVRLAVAETV